MPMDVIDQANRLVASGQRQAAVDLVRGAADAGDPNALFAVANWRLFGMYGPRDEAEAHALLDRARAAGNLDAIRLKATLLANGTGGEPNPDAAGLLLEEIRDRDPGAAEQLRLISAAGDKRGVNAKACERLADDPDIHVVRQLLSADECRYLIAAAQPELRPSFVVDPQTGGHMPHPVRTSSGMNFDPTLEDLVVRSINERLAAATGTAVECGEPLYVLRYAPGQEYKPHLDAMPSVDNQREWTVLTYLNDGYTGGETRFDLLGIEFRGDPGDALIFRNVDSTGQLDPRLRHAGAPVQSGIKWLATRWIRAKPHDPWTTSY
jgi:prolyl 4-hydroxylase